MLTSMGIEGYALFVVVVLVAAYVLPYLYSRRRVLAQVSLDDRYSENLRLLRVPEKPNGVSENGPTGAVLFRRPEVIMDENRTTGEVGELVRKRSRRKARISTRAVNRQRGRMGVGVLTVLALVLLIVAAVSSFSWVPGIVVAVLAAGAGGFFAYLLRQMNDADISDRDAIADINADLAALRGGTSASRRPPAARQHSAAALMERGSQKSERAGGSAERTDNSAEAEESASPKTSARTRNRKVASGAAETERGRAHTARTAHPSATKVRARVEERRPNRSVSASAGQRPARSGQAKPAPQRVVRRAVSPYIPPEVDSAPVPYRPKRVGESLDTERRVPSRGGLAGGRALDDTLRRRQA